METPEKHGTPVHGNTTVLDKLREQLGYYRRKALLAQNGSKEEIRWMETGNGLAIAIEILEGEQ